MAVYLPKRSTCHETRCSFQQNAHLEREEIEGVLEIERKELEKERE